MNLDRMSLGQMYDRLHDLRQQPESAYILWEIADVLEAIKQTENGEV